ncbi:MAG TPA: hypothetical protein VLL52_16540, partial [Anaerolineae bacterium]|nr:hypothetical protein [Anaerolineae bacterium]
MSRVIGRLVVLLAVVLMLLWGGVEILRAGLVAERWGVVAEGEERAVATVISGTINSPMTWSVANSPYLLQGWVTIAPGVTVTVEPGVTVQGALDSVLFVDGHLASVGTAGQPILFTSEANTAPGEWIGLVVNGSAELDWTTLRYGNGTPLMAWPSDPNDQVIVRNSIIEETLGYGLHTRADKWHQVVMSNVQFVNNQLDAVLVQTFSGGDYYQPQESLHLEAMPGLLGYEMEGGSLVVSQGMTLTVDAGLALWMPASSSLDVLGHLDVRGTFEAPNFIGPLGAGNWYGVNFSGSGVLDYAYIFGAGEGGQPAMWVGPNDPTDMVVLNNSWLDLNDAATIRTRADKVHQLQMNNVSFVDNGSNVVEIETYDGFEYFALADSVTLTPQPGLEGYVIKEQMLMVSPGMTLTLAAGTQLMGNSGTGLDVLGHLAVMGTVTQPVTMTSRLNSGPGEWIGINFSGSGEINYGTIRSAGEGGFPAMWVGPNDPTDMVLFNHSRIENNGGAALETRANKLHQLLLSDTEFGNNGQDVVLIETYDGFEYFALADSVTLTPQPGLEGYVIKEQMLMVSPGMTLTLAAGTQLMGNSGTSLEVLGHLAVMGTASQPVTMTSRLNSGPGEWYGVNFSGSGEVNYGVIRYAGQNSLPAVWVGPNDPTDMVLFKDSRIESNGGVAMETRADKLHRLQMNNTEFRNNSQNQVVIETYDGFEYFALADSATLTPQPGLEGYLIEQQALMVSPGMTLTLAAGTQLMGNSGTSLEVLGHLAVMGTASQPVTMTSGLNSGPGEWYGVYFSGSGEVNYGVIRYAGQNSLPAVWVGPNDPTDMVLFNDSRIESNG